MAVSFKLAARETLYRVLRRYLFARSADDAHQLVMARLGALDNRPVMCDIAARVWGHSVTSRTSVGRVSLDTPLVLAAGLIKGVGFATEDEAMGAVEKGHNIMPGWRSVPTMIGPVEMGSFTPRPRLGNDGQVLWRDTKRRNLENRMGLPNPGAVAAASFLGKHSEHLPDVYGISIASDPDQTDADLRWKEVAEAVHSFVEAGIRPSWTTVNISCPNVNKGYDYSEIVKEVVGMCKAVRRELPDETDLWVKVGPDWGKGCYRLIAQAAVEGGANAIVATNTAPGQNLETGERVGVGGSSLHHRALDVVTELDSARRDLGLTFDIVGCGGVVDGRTYQAFRDRGAAAVQYWSALVFRGPNAPDLILSESEQL